MSDLYVREGDATNTVYVRVSVSTRHPQIDVTVSVTVLGGTASAATDFDRLSAPDTLTVPHNVRDAEIPITVFGDLVKEPDEKFVVTISNPLNATLGQDTATVTLLNDDGDIVQALPDSYVITPDLPSVIPASIGLLANDSTPGSGPLTAKVVAAPNHGTLELASDGSFTFTPEVGYMGWDQFEYAVCESVFYRCARGAVTLRVGVEPGTDDTVLWTVPPASDSQHQGFLRFTSTADGPVNITLYGLDSSSRFASRPITMTLAPHESRQLNSQDLELGNPGKGLSGAFGAGEGNWTVIETSPDALALSSSPPFVMVRQISANGYIRTPDGFLTSMHDQAYEYQNDWKVPTFNPASNTNQVSWLRLFNLNEQEAAVTISGIDDAGVAGTTVALTIPALHSVDLTATDLESGNAAKGLLGSMGHGTGKWRLDVRSDVNIAVQNLLSDPKGYLTDLSSYEPDYTAGAGQHFYFIPRADNPTQQGFIRFTNPNNDFTVYISLHGIDETGKQSRNVFFTLAPNESRQFNSSDLEYGNPAKASGSFGSGTGDWRVMTDSYFPSYNATAYIRTTDGFLTAVNSVITIHDFYSPYNGTVPIFNPAENHNQVSALRLTNVLFDPITITIRGTDDSGHSNANDLQLTIPAQATVELSATDLESGNATKGLVGSLGNGTGKWTLHLTSEGRFRAMNLLRDPNGYVTDLSTSPKDVVDWMEFLP